MKEIILPEAGLVLLLGVPQLKKHFLPEEFVDVNHESIAKGLQEGRMVVVDGTGLGREARAILRALAKEHYSIVTVLADPQYSLKDEGFRRLHFIADDVAIVRERLFCNQKEDRGPFDIIGDIHGCYEELQELLTLLGYSLEGLGHPENRKLIFLGDLADRGKDAPGVLRLVMEGVKSGRAYCVCGNHEEKLLRYLEGKNLNLGHGLDKTVEQLNKHSDAFKTEVKEFIENLQSHYVLDGGMLVVAHAGLPEKMHGKPAGSVKAFAAYGQTTGQVDERGYPIRDPWPDEYHGKALVVYGHTPVAEPDWCNNTVNIDTGCVFGGRLSSLRYPEKEVVAVKAKEVYSPRIGWPKI